MRPAGFILGFHGCDKSIGEKILAGQENLKPSTNDYDWLGNGIYFWENSPARALSWASFLQANPGASKGKISEPFVIGAIVDLGLCLDLTEQSSLEFVRFGYESLKEAFIGARLSLPQNKPGASQDTDLIRRHLDCAVINHAHRIREEGALPIYDTVRGVFPEGKALYPGARIMSKTHVQVCVRHPRSIKGYFRPVAEVLHLSQARPGDN